MRHEIQRYSSVRAAVEIVTAGIGQTGKSPTVAIQDLDSGDWLQNGGGSWAAGFATNALSELDATNLAGFYEYEVPSARVLEKDSSTFEGFLFRIVEATTNLIEHVRVDLAFSPDLVRDAVANGRTVGSVLGGLYRAALTGGDTNAVVGVDSIAATDLSLGKFYQTEIATADSARYVDRLAVVHDTTGSGEYTDIVRIGGIFTDGGGDYFLLQNPDGTTYNEAITGVGVKLYIRQEFITSRVDVIEDDVITANALATSAVDELVDATWDEPLAGHSTGGTAGKVLSDLSPLTVASIADQVWTETLADHSGVGGSTAEALAGVTSSAIADAVWDEAVADHLGAGSTGAALNTAGAAASAADVADAVWDEAVAGHLTSGTFGKALAVTQGLVQANHRLKSPTYDPNGRLLTADLVVYPTGTDATNDTSPLFTFSVTCTYDGDGNLTSLLSAE